MIGFVSTFVFVWSSDIVFASVFVFVKLILICREPWLRDSLFLSSHPAFLPFVLRHLDRWEVIIVTLTDSSSISCLLVNCLIFCSLSPALPQAARERETGCLAQSQGGGKCCLQVGSTAFTASTASTASTAASISFVSTSIPTQWPWQCLRSSRLFSVTLPRNSDFRGHVF